MKTCGQCGRESEDHATFCRYCGNRFEETLETDAVGVRHGKKFLIPTIAGAVFLTAVAIGGAFLLLRHPGGGTETDISGTEAEETQPEETQPELEGGAELLDLSNAELVDNYVAPESAGVIDLGARNHQPGIRDTSAQWNKDLFYWLEDIGGEDDNHIAESILTRMELTETGSGHTIQYEVYRNPETEEIQKIVSIEPGEDGNLELSDFYYQGGKPDFVFRRSDSIYTPSYATIDKIGERYYFSEDQMVKWRWIYEPSVVKQWILELEDTWYTQWTYGEITDGERDQYDEKEFQVLNEAYNTYDAVLANDPVAVLQGRVVDENGEPIEEVEVGIGTVVDGKAQVPKMKVLTDETGNYCWPAEEDGEVQEYFLVFQKQGFIPSMMAVPDMGSRYQTLHTTQENMVLLKEKGEEPHTVTFCAYQVDSQDEEQMLARAFAEEEALLPLENAKVRVYAGINWFAGEPVAEDKSLKDGQMSVELLAGVYTAVVEKEGYLPSRNIVQVKEEDQEQVVYVMRDNSSSAENSETDNEWRVLLSWNASEHIPIDLDGSLFTPDKAARGDRNCINTLNRNDGAGARFLYDGEGNNACEAIILSSPKRGSYKYYVSNYTGIQNGNGLSTSFAQAGARVTLFHNGVPIRTFFPPETSGKVWEVFELRDQGIVPIQEVYESTEGKDWWTEDKKLARLSERGVKANWIQSDGEWLYFSNPADDGKLYYCRKDGSDLTKFSDDYLEDSKILLIGDQIYYIARQDHYVSGRSYFDIVRVKNDGTERTVVQKDLQTAEIELCAGIFLMGYADGMIYYYNSSEISRTGAAFCIDQEQADTSVWSVADLDTNGNYPYYDYGTNPIGAAVVGNYLYYMNHIEKEGNYADIGTHAFCRKSLTTGEEECLKPEVNWHPWSWRIYKGWIYYTENGVIKRTRLMGPGSFEEEQVLADNGIRCEDVYSIETEELDYSLGFYGDTCYYQGDDSQMHAMNLDGSNQRTLMPFERGNAVIRIDSEFYKNGSYTAMVYDRNGENGRPLFDHAPFANRAAMESYAGYAEAIYQQKLSQYKSKYRDSVLYEAQYLIRDFNQDGIQDLLVFQHRRTEEDLFNEAELYTIVNGNISLCDSLTADAYGGTSFAAFQKDGYILFWSCTSRYSEYIYSITPSLTFMQEVYYTIHDDAGEHGKINENANHIYRGYIRATDIDEGTAVTMTDLK